MSSKLLKEETQNMLMKKHIINFTMHEEQGFLHIITPYLYANKDVIELFLEETSNGYLLSDDRNTFFEFEMNHFNVQTHSKTNQLFDNLLNYYNVQYNEDTDELFIEFNELNELDFALISLVHCLQKVSALAT